MLMTTSLRTINLNDDNGDDNKDKIINLSIPITETTKTALTTVVEA